MQLQRITRQISDTTLDLPYVIPHHPTCIPCPPSFLTCILLHPPSYSLCFSWTLLLQWRCLWLCCIRRLDRFFICQWSMSMLLPLCLSYHRRCRRILGRMQRIPLCHRRLYMGGNVRGGVGDFLSPRLTGPESRGGSNGGGSRGGRRRGHVSILG